MLEVIIVTMLGVIIIVQNTYILDDLHEYHDKLVSIKELESDKR